MNLLEIDHLSIQFKRYANGINFSSKENLNPVKDLNIAAKEGELTVILGSSGSGKTLLANALTGILPQNAIVNGNIRLNNKQYSFDSFFKYHKTTFIPQSLSYLDPLMTIKKQALDITRINGFNDAEGIQKLRSFLQHYQLDEQVLSFYPHQLSGGMARRILIIMASLNPSSLLIADEPTPGLDEGLILDVWNYLKENKPGRINLVITHDLRNALLYADHIFVFDNGTIVDQFETQTKKYGEFTQRLITCLPENKFTDYFMERSI